MATRSIGGNYWDNFTTNAWTLNSDGVYTMTISNDLHGLGYGCHLEILRLQGGKYQSVALHYEVDASGNITAYSAEAFAGNYFVVSGV